MRIDLQNMSQDAMRDAVSVGDVYRANGGRGDCKFWVVVALSSSAKMAHCIGINRDGEICTSTSYGIHVFEQRMLVGRCEDIVTFQPSIDWRV